MASPPSPPGHTWRTGTRTSSSLTEHLRHVTESAANAAVENYTSQDEGELLWAAISAGLAVEAALKFSIAKANPVLLADSRGGTASAVLLARHTTTAFAPLALKTITGMAAFSIFRALHDERKGSPNGKECEQVFSVRNSAVHMGVVEPAEVRTAVRNMVVLLQSVMELEEGDPSVLWQDTNLELAESLADERSTETARGIAEKKAVAGRRYQKLILGLAAAQQEELLRSIEAHFTSNLDGIGRVTHTCPACERNGLLVRHVTRDDFDFTGASYPDNEPTGGRYAYAEEFVCFVCGLALDEDELYIDPAFEDVIEEEVDPSEEFERALEDWRYEERAEMRREAERDEQRRDFEF